MLFFYVTHNNESLQGRAQHWCLKALLIIIWTFRHLNRFKTKFGLREVFFFLSPKFYFFCERPLINRNKFKLQVNVNETKVTPCQLTLWRLKTYTYISRTAQLTSRRCILNIYSTNILTEYFKHAAHSPFFLFKMPFIS